MSEKRSISVRVFGQEYHIRSEADEAIVQRAAALLDETMSTVNQRTSAVDTLNIAVLAGLNIANLLLAERAQADAGGGIEFDPDRLRTLIELVESSAEQTDPPSP